VGRMATQQARLHFQAEIEHFRAGLVEMASLVLSQVERAVAAWEQVDAGAAAEVIAGDDQVDERCAELDQKVFNLQLLEAPVASDQRLLHVGLIAVIALERVGDLAVAIAEASTSVRPEGAVPEVEALISRMSARAVDTLARAVQAIARGDAELGEEAADDADKVRSMLGEVITAVAAAPDEPETRVWSASAVLVARHLERVANNGAELGGRVRFLVSGEPFVRSVSRPPGTSSPGG
jgi:phosphate transport system protein